MAWCGSARQSRNGREMFGQAGFGLVRQSWLGRVGLGAVRYGSLGMLGQCLVRTGWDRQSWLGGLCLGSPGFGSYGMVCLGSVGFGETRNGSCGRACRCWACLGVLRQSRYGWFRLVVERLCLAAEARLVGVWYGTSRLGKSGIGRGDVFQVGAHPHNSSDCIILQMYYR